MSAIPTEMEKIATAVAVGSIFCFGVFLILDVLHESFFMQFEGYVTTASFGVIAAIPTLAFLYIVGALISLTENRGQTGISSNCSLTPIVADCYRQACSRAKLYGEYSHASITKKRASAINRFA